MLLSSFLLRVRRSDESCEEVTGLASKSACCFLFTAKFTGLHQLKTKENESESESFEIYEDSHTRLLVFLLALPTQNTSKQIVLSRSSQFESLKLMVLLISNFQYLTKLKFLQLSTVKN